MKLKLKTVSALAAFAAAAFTAQADTAGALDLVVGFKQNGATNDVLIDLGQVSNYTAPGTYVIGNYNSILTANFGGASWSSSSSLLWGAASGFKDSAFVLPSVNYISSKWTSASGTLGVANSTTWSAKAASQLDSATQSIGKAYSGLGTYSVGVAEQIATSNTSSWKSATTTGASSFGQYTATQFNNNLGNIANSAYSASDLYVVGNSSAGTTTQFIGTFALYTNGDLTFTVIPEPSTYAAILGVATLGFAAIRRRKQQIESQV